MLKFLIIDPLRGLMTIFVPEVLLEVALVIGISKNVEEVLDV